MIHIQKIIFLTFEYILRLKKNIFFSLDQLTFDHESDEHEKTLTQASDSYSTLRNRPLLDTLERYLPLSNTGNIDVKVDCYLTTVNATTTTTTAAAAATPSSHNTSDEILDQHSTVACIDGTQFELRLPDRQLDVPVRSRLKSFVRLFLGPSSDEKPTDSQSPLKPHVNEKMKLVIQVAPNGFKFEIPIRVTFTMKTTLLPAQIRQTTATCNISSSNAGSLTSVKLFSSRSVLFFGCALSADEASSQCYDEEFTIMNSNPSLRITCQLTITLSGETSSSSSCFQFVKNENNNSNNNELASYNENGCQMRVSLAPKQEWRIRVRYTSNHSSLVEIDSNIVRTGKIRMCILGTAQKFGVNLVAFSAACQLKVMDKPVSVIARLNAGLETQLEKRMHARNLSKNLVELSQTISTCASNVYRHVLKLITKGSRCILMPMLYSVKANGSSELKPVVGASQTSACSNSLCFNLAGDMQLKLILNKSVRLHHSEQASDLSWIEIRASHISETTCFNIELTTNGSSTTLDSESSSVCEHICLCFFCIEFDIASYMYQLAQINIQKVASHLSSLGHSDNLVDALFARLVNSKSIFVTENLNESRLKRLSITSTSSLDSYASNVSDQTSSWSLGNYSANGPTKSMKLSTGDDLARLFRLALKCSLVKLSIAESTSSSNSFYNNNSNTSYVTQTNSRCIEDDSLELGASSSISLPKSRSREHIIDNSFLGSATSSFSSVSVSSSSMPSSWTLSSSCVLIENITSERLINSYVGSFFLRNNMSGKPLEFTLKYDMACLKVMHSPEALQVQPLAKLEIAVQPKHAVFGALPWQGVIRVICINNQSHKDVQVTLCGAVSNKLVTTSLLSMPVEICLLYF